MRVVLVLPGSGFRNSSPTSLAGGEHLGLGSIAAYLRGHGHDVAILNYQVEDSLAEAPHTVEQVTKRILAHEPDVVGMSITGLTIGQALVATEELKRSRPSMHICWGGHQAASCAEAILTNERCVDTIVAGDGEIPMLRLVQALDQGTPLSDVPGLWFRQTHNPRGLLSLSEVRMTSKPPEPEIDELPFPARDTLQSLIERSVPVADARIYTSRGCPFRCTFCVYPALDYLKRWRDRSPEKIVEEIRHLRDTYNITHFWFSDDNFTLPSKRSRFRALELAEVLIAEDLGVTYRVLMRADAVAGQEELMEALARSGLTCAYMGLESGSPRRLQYFDKHANPDTYRRAVQIVRKYRIGLQIGFIMFDPLTSWEDLRIDADFLYDLTEMSLYTNYAQTLFAYPGTPVATQLIDMGLLPQDFNYRSGYQEYSYLDPQIGALACVVEGRAQQWVRNDDFFRRLRMLDVPGLYRHHPGIADDVNGLVEEKNAVQNQRGYDLFLALLDLGQAGRLDEAARLIDEHRLATEATIDELIVSLSGLPQHIVQDLSAFKYASLAPVDDDVAAMPEYPHVRVGGEPGAEVTSVERREHWTRT